MLEQKKFLKKYNISEEQYHDTGFKWQELKTIYEDYLNYKNSSDIEPTANYITECLRRQEKVHLIRVRIKDPERLIAKIIRKKIENDETIEINNYKEKITDIIAVRAIHLFKEDWLDIHKYILDKWEPIEKIANVRVGDHPDFIKNYKENQCKIVNHKHGYRSVHYIVPFKNNSSSNPIYVEIQVRTIFEEGWSEIDHFIRYPYDMDNIILGSYLAFFNRLTGSADEMGTYINNLKNYIDGIGEKYNKEVQEKNKIFEELQSKVDELNIKDEHISQLMDKLKKYTLTHTAIPLTVYNINPVPETHPPAGTPLENKSLVVQPNPSDSIISFNLGKKE